MNIITSRKENFDLFINCSKNYSKEFLIQELEKRDDEIAATVDKGRFKIIRKSYRTLLTSIGIITYKRRYYFDYLDKEYVHLLDNALELPKYSRMSSELRLKILDLASIMTYRETGEHLSDEFTLHKSTIYKTISNTLIEQVNLPIIYREDNIVHLQLDEKYIGMTKFSKKKRYYTATIFAGFKQVHNKRVLNNKTVISAYKLSKLKNLIRDNLLNRYNVKENEIIYLSGDFATYIRNFVYEINDICKPIYVPDKFHVKRAINKEFGWLPNDYELTRKESVDLLINKITKESDPSIKGLKQILQKNKEAFDPYLDKSYLGCSQEGMNSHVYAPRFGKYQNRFNPITIEKLSLITEARINHGLIKITSIDRLIEDIKVYDLDVYHKSEELRFDLDTRSMKAETARMFNKIKYGD